MACVQRKPDLKLPLRVALAIMCLSTLAMTSCIGSTRGPRGVPPRSGAGVQLSVELDQTLSDAEIGALETDLARVLAMQLVPARGTWFHSVFGGTDVQAVIRYLNERIRYIYSANERMLDEAVHFSGMTPVEPGSAPDADDGGDILAVNYSPLLWFTRIMSERPSEVSVRFNGRLVPVQSTRAGIVQLGPLYSMPKASDGTPITSIERIGTLVHEARHSDCVGGLGPGDVARIRGDRTPLNESCGFLHAVCPPSVWNDPRYPNAEHPYAGQEVCDAAPWGPSAIEAIFYQALKSDCRDCTELERQTAIAGYADTAIRVIPFWQMIDGKVGVPDMSSLGLVP